MAIYMCESLQNSDLLELKEILTQSFMVVQPS